MGREEMTSQELMGILVQLLEDQTGEKFEYEFIGTKEEVTA